MIKRYPAVYELTPNNYAAYLPDLPGCVTTDGDWAEIQSNFPEAIEFHIQGLIRNRDGAPDAVLSVGDAMSFHIRTIAESDRAAVELETTVGLVDVEVNPPASVEA